MNTLLRWIYRYFSFVPDGVPIHNWRFYMVSNFANTTGMLLHLFWVTFFFAMGAGVLGWVNTAATLVLLGNIFLIRKRMLVAAGVIAVMVLLVEYSIAIYFLGPEMEFQYFILLVSLFPLMMPDGNFWPKYVLFALCLCAFVGMDFWSGWHVPMVTFDPEIVTRLRIFNMTTSFTVLGMYAMFYNHAMNRTEARLEEMYDEAQGLLHNILPKSIARELKEDPHAIANKHSEVSVLFADLVGFTRLSTEIEPIKLVNLLNKIFSLFDDLAEKHGMEKIKTIGDAYMAVAGLPLPVENHAERTAEMALELLTELKKFNLREDTRFSLRLGIDSGSVVAGVIGKKKFTYDLWGDTVNTASRMESNGEPDRIQITANTYALIKDKFVVEERPLMVIKGKGEMQTYFLLGKRE